MVRAPYFVYNPWVDGNANYTWLSMHMPVDAVGVALDIEVGRSGYSPATYASEVAKFVRLVAARWNVVLYTGQWFLSNLSTWPRNVEYWWAQYPLAFYPSGVTRMTWENIRALLLPYSGPFNLSAVPGTLRMWQFTGDRLLLPGSDKPLDISVYYGERAALERQFGKPGITPPPPISQTDPDLYYVVPNVKGAASGPAVQPCSIAPKEGLKENVKLAYPAWDNYLKAINGGYANKVEWIGRADTGPSQGRDETGRIRLITLAYPGNFVRVQNWLVGTDNERWASIEHVTKSVPDAATVNYERTPHLVHKLWGWNTANKLYELTGGIMANGGIRVPIVDDTPLYLPQNVLIPLSQRLPRSCKAKALPWLNVRNMPLYGTVTGRKLPGAVLLILDVRLMADGLWGRTLEGWVALRFTDLQFALD